MVECKRSNRDADRSLSNPILLLAGLARRPVQHSVDESKCQPTKASIDPAIDPGHERERELHRHIETELAELTNQATHSPTEAGYIRQFVIPMSSN